ncbi:MAG TPA: MFS transporter [Acidimicrobiales bacterium]|nr:MFS transporter [Acidimicrobiales bacterium]
MVDRVRPGGPSDHRSGTAVLATAMILVAANLRIAIASVSPVLDEIRHGLHLSPGEAGLLTTVPVVCFGTFAFAAGPLTRWYGPDRLVPGILLFLAAGILLRLVPSVGPLFAGTVVIGGAVAVGNVLMPSLVKREFPRRLGPATGAYSMSLFVGAALSAGLTVPLQSAFGLDWNEALALWAVPAVAAAVLWSSRLRPHRRADAVRPSSSGPGGHRGPGQPGGSPGAGRSPVAGQSPVAGPPGASPVAEQPAPTLRALAGDPLAWAVTGFMGLQSLGYYATLAWVPSLLRAHGMSAGQAGWLLSFSSFPGMAAALATPSLARRLRRQWVAVVAAVGLCAVAYVGLAVQPVALAYLWMVVLGIGQGIGLSLALSYIALRSPDVHHTGQLSTMAQGGGYLIACLGPVGLGVLHAASGGWTVPMLALTALALAQLAAGVGASRDRHVLAGPR